MQTLAIAFKNFKGKTQTLHWKIQDRPVAKKWITLLQTLEWNGSRPPVANPWDFWAVGHTPEHFKKIQDRIIEISKHLNQIQGFDIPMEMCENLTQQNLNTLHLKFHEVAEKLDTSIYEVDQLNRLVHNAEACLNNILYQSQSNHVILTLNPVGKLPMEDEDYLDFTDTIIPNGSLVVSYSTVGKSLFHCSRDNDLDLVKQRMVRPKVTLSCEVRLSLHIDGDIEIDKQITHYNKWCNDNHVIDYGYDYKHFIHTPKKCVLAIPLGFDPHEIYQWAIDSDIGDITVVDWKLLD